MIISASRRTDIPSYYSKWFINRLEEGYALVRNPINAGQVSKISLSPEHVDCIVFWSKNPEPMLPSLNRLGAYTYYFLFTLTSYGQDIEVNVPSKSGGVIDTFKRLADKIGRGRVIWRYDPILLSGKYTASYHCEYFGEIARRLNGYTDKCVISFINEYAKNKRGMERLGISPLTVKEKTELAGNLAKVALELGMTISACAEDLDLENLGIGRSKCIDDKYIEGLIGRPLNVKKDKGQRSECGCVSSVDIGRYNTCGNGCVYCYANHSQSSVRRNISLYDPDSPLLCDNLKETDKIMIRNGL